MKSSAGRNFLLIILALAVALEIAVVTRRGLAQDDQSSGPKPAVGETVLAPKKPAPNAPPPPEKKIEKINPNTLPTISTTTNLVNVNVLVTDNDGNPIPSLTSANFKITDDGVPQSVTNFGTTEAPMTVCMMIEYSNKYWEFLYRALEAAYNFLNFIQPKDWVAVVSFDMQPHILTDFTQDRSQVRDALDELNYPGFQEVNMYDAVSDMLNRMKDIQGRKAILLIGTGCDTFSKMNYDTFLKVVKASDTVIYPVSIFEFLTVRYGNYVPCGPATVGFGGGEEFQARNVMQTIAKYTGGQAYFPRFEAEFPGIYQQIAGQLRTQYSLGFVPTNPARDGKFHKLKVELVNADGNPLRIVNQKGKTVKYRIVARDGYYAPKS